MLFERETWEALAAAVTVLESSFADLPSFEPVKVNQVHLRTVLTEVARRMGDNFPYFHPLYAGQMLKPPHPIARAAYALATLINPNNHALDGGRASSAMEKEAVADLAAMYGWQTHLGHLTGGGTMANLEALWVAGQLQPGKKIVASAQAHYTHRRISGVLHLPFETVATDHCGRMDCSALERKLSDGDVGCVVATLGTTATGSVDPLPAILDLQERFAFRLHVDTAYGGYFGLVDNLAPESCAAFKRACEADSIVIDPHKHGLQPYGCGCILFRDPEVGALYKHDSPYTYFSSNDLHLGEISLECSRPGASAVALWATQRLLPPVTGGLFAQGLASSRWAALQLAARLQDDPRFVVPCLPDLDIVVWAVRASSVSMASALAQRIFDAAAEHQLHLALTRLPISFFKDIGEPDQDEIVCLRSVLMKPEHEAWLDRIYERLDLAANQVMRND